MPHLLSLKTTLPPRPPRKSPAAERSILAEMQGKEDPPRLCRTGDTSISRVIGASPAPKVMQRLPRIEKHARPHQESSNDTSSASFSRLHNPPPQKKKKTTHITDRSPSMPPLSQATSNLVGRQGGRPHSEWPQCWHHRHEATRPWQ